MSRILLVGIVVIGILLGMAALAAATPRQLVRAAEIDKATSEVRSALTASGRTRIIVQLQSPTIAVNGASTDAIAALQQSVLDSLSSSNFQLSHRYQTLAAFAGEIDSAGIAVLQANPNVASITLDHPGAAHLAQSVPALHADIVSNTYGITGKGITVAVLDSGVDIGHADLQDAIIGQHCFTQAEFITDTTGDCQPGFTLESNNAQDLNGHGTNVSGIVTANGKVAGPGFAPDAKIVAVRVLDRYGRGWVSDWVAGLDWLSANYNTQPIDIVNMSLGTFALYSGNCDSQEPTMNMAVDNLRAKGVVIFASSGNQASSTNIASPACNSGVIAVGATYDSNVGRQPPSGGYSSFFGPSSNCFDVTTSLNTITCFTNSNAQLDLLAPGAPIESTGWGGGTSLYYGTSQASPTAAAIAALMLEKDPSLSPDEIESLLKSSGYPITDTRNSLVFPRIDALTAVNAIDFYHHIAPSTVAISGPSQGELNTSYLFTATVSPISTTVPLTYSWSATDHGITSIITTTRSVALAFSWSSPGVKQISVTVENLYGTVQRSAQITINAPLPTPLISVSLQGATTGLMGAAQSFTAIISPANATLPISYRWQATGQSPVLHGGGTSDQISFTWPLPGTYQVVVTATNAANVVVSDSLTVTIDSIIPESIALKASSTAQTNESVPFLAAVSPATTQTPITYTWTASDHATKIRIGGIQDSVSYSWSQAGVYTVAVSADNGLGVVSNSRTITVNAVNEVVALQNVTISGPEEGLINEALSFTATVAPDNATAPISYTWDAFGKSAQTQVTGSQTSLVFSWPQTGTFPITVTAANISGSVSSVMLVHIRMLAPLAIIIDGPEVVYAGTMNQFTATLLPSRTSLPIMYEWSATDQSTMTHQGELSDEVQYQWSSPGEVLIHVKASNGAGEVTGEKSVEVVRLDEKLYLPLVTR
ncbi:MAG: S8 family serine peptidase [Caldilineaceae bacterium]